MSRTMQVLLPVVLGAVLVTGCSSDDAPTATRSGGAVTPSPVPTSAPSTSGSDTSTDEGVVFALLRTDSAGSGPGLDVTYDKLAYIPDCGGAEFTVAYGLEREFEACWRNDNAKLRTVRLSDSADITVIGSEGDPQGIAPDELQIVLADEADNRRPLRIAVFKIVIRGGVAVALTELGEARLSGSDEELAR